MSFITSAVIVFVFKSQLLNWKPK